MTAPGRHRALLAAALMACASAGAYVATPRVKLADLQTIPRLEVLFPERFGSWRIDDSIPVVLPAPDVQARLDKIYNQVLTRTYVDQSGYRMMLSVAYGGDQSDGMQVHLPEVCYPAQGFQVHSRQPGQMDVGPRSIPVVRLVTQMARRVEPVTYWITVGNDVIPSRTQQKLTQIRYGLRGLIPDGMLIRVSSIDANTATAFERQRAFAADLAAAMSKAARARIFGSPDGNA